MREDVVTYLVCHELRWCHHRGSWSADMDNVTTPSRLRVPSMDRLATQLHLSGESKSRDSWSRDRVADEAEFLHKAI